MEKFIVSARKYRPQLFDTVVGQAHIKTTLKNAIKHNQLAHAFLFCGPRVLERPPVPGYWLKQSIVKTRQRTVRHAIAAIPASRLMKGFR